MLISKYRLSPGHYLLALVLIITISDYITITYGSTVGISAYQPKTTYILATAPVQYPNGTVSNETVYYQPAEGLGESYPSASSYQPTGSYDPYSYSSRQSLSFPSSPVSQSNPHDLASTYSPYSYAAAQPTTSDVWRMQKRRPPGFPREYEGSSKYDKHKLLSKLYNQNQLKHLKKKKGKKRNKFSHKYNKMGHYGGRKWLNNRQDLDFEAEESDDEENLFDYPDFLFSGLDMSDLEDVEDPEDDLLFGGDGEDPFVEETFARPSFLGLNDGINVAASGIRNGLAEAFPGLGFHGDKKRIFGVGLPFMPRFLLKKFGFGVKILVAIMLLPLILLFLPIPILNSTPTTTNSRNKDEGTQEQVAQGNPVLEYGRRVLKSENCIERISCEIKNFEQVTGVESDEYLFPQFMTFVSNFDVFFPTILGRVARGYKSLDGDKSCSNFECTTLKSHLMS